MELTGKLVSIKTVDTKEEIPTVFIGDIATIELEKPKEVKVGNVVLIKYKIDEANIERIKIDEHFNCGDFRKDDIVAIVSEDKEEDKFDPQSMDAVIWAKEFMRLYENSKFYQNTFL